MRKPRSKSQPAQEALTRDEWDFTGIPQDELWIAEIYEYSREIDAVRDAVNDWLNQEAVLIEDRIPCPTKGYQEIIKKLGVTSREALSMWRDNGLWRLMEDHSEPRLSGHKLAPLGPIVAEWPNPFKAVRNTPGIKRAINELNEPLPFANLFHLQVVTGANSTKRYGEDWTMIKLAVNRNATLSELKNAFAKICANLTTKKRGRKPRHVPSSIRLKQLAAYRLYTRGIGPGRPFKTFEHFQIKILELDPEGEQTLLPNHSTKKGFLEAVRLARQRIKEFKVYERFALGDASREGLENKVILEEADFNSRKRVRILKEII